jgi:hypothetical protein
MAGGGEFCNKALGEILDREGIIHNVAPPYTPENNGLAERANCTVIEMTRCLMLQENLAGKWWGEAAITALNTTNAFPSLAKSRSAPMLLFRKIEPNLQVFQPFGCRAWALMPKANHGEKFEAISWEGTLIGYANDLSTYHILRHEDKKIIKSRNVRFEEACFPHHAALNRSQ